jgi:vacuolar-type H+-ATPase subunit H
MAKQETVDFVAAFAIGALLGVGATLLLRSGGESEVERVMREIRPLRKKAVKRVRRAGQGIARGVDAAESAGEELLDSGRAALGDLREQVADIIASARQEIGEAARDSVRDAQRAVRRGLRT